MSASGAPGLLGLKRFGELNQPGILLQDLLLMAEATGEVYFDQGSFCPPWLRGLWGQDFNLF
jgi:hypothetical protein